MTNRIGFIGLGNMGQPMVKNLAAKGKQVLAFDLSSERRRLVEGLRNVSLATNLKDFADCSVVILMLPNGKIVRDILVGDGELYKTLPDNCLAIDMSSSDPADYSEITDRIGKTGIQLIDAPVSGNVSGAEAGTLTIMAGGEEQALSIALPILNILGKTIFHTGSLGTGQSMKALNNLLSAGGLILAAEVLLTAKAAGLNPEQATEILNVSTGRNNSTEKKILPFVLSRKYNSGFGLSLMAKDLRTAASVAERSGLDLPLSKTVVAAANSAEELLQPGADHTEVARWLEKITGQKI